MKKIVLVVLFLIGTALPARASEVIPWDGTGVENLPCPTGAHWYLDPGYGIEGATVTIDGTDWPMVLANETYGSLAVDSGPVSGSSVVSLTFDGTWTYPDQLILTSCLPYENAPTTQPPVPPTQTPTPTTPTLITWTLGFRVRTIRPTNVVARYRIVCDGMLTRGRVQTRTPVSRTFTGFEGATSCHIRVRAWDLKPWVRPHNPPPPVVTTWVTHD